MSDGPGRVPKVDEADVRQLGDHAVPAHRRDLVGKAAEPVAQDRKIVGTQIPDDADVGLVEAEVDAAGRDEIDLAELPGIDEALDRGHRRAVDERVAGHEDQVVAICHLGQLEDVLAGRGERLLHEDMLAGLEGGPCERVVRRNGRRDRNGVDVSVAKDVFVPGRASDAGVAPGDGIERFLPHVAGPGELEHRRLGEVPNEVRAPVAEAHDCDPDGRRCRAVGRLPRHQPVSFGRKTSAGVRSSRRRSSPSDHPRA